MQLKMVSSHKKKRTPFTNNNQTILPHDGKRKKTVVQQTNWYTHLKQRHWFSDPLYQTGKKQELPGLRKNPQRRIWAIHFLCHAGEVQRLSDTPQQGGKSQSKTDRLSSGAGTGGSRNWKAAGYADQANATLLAYGNKKIWRTGHPPPDHFEGDRRIAIYYVKFLKVISLRSPGYSFHLFLDILYWS